MHLSRRTGGRGVVAGTAVEDVPEAGPAVEAVVARFAEEVVGAGCALEVVVAVAAVEPVVAFVPDDRVGTVLAVDRVVADVPREDVVSVAAEDLVVAVSTGDGVVAGTAPGWCRPDRRRAGRRSPASPKIAVGPGAAEDLVVAVPAVQLVGVVTTVQGVVATLTEDRVVAVPARERVDSTVPSVTATVVDAVLFAALVSVALVDARRTSR